MVIYSPLEGVLSNGIKRQRSRHEITSFRIGTEPIVSTFKTAIGSRTRSSSWPSIVETGMAEVDGSVNDTSFHTCTEVSSIVLDRGANEHVGSTRSGSGRTRIELALHCRCRCSFVEGGRSAVRHHVRSRGRGPGSASSWGIQVNVSRRPDVAHFWASSQLGKNSRWIVSIKAMGRTVLLCSSTGLDGDVDGYTGEDFRVVVMNVRLCSVVGRLLYEVEEAVGQLL